MEIGKQIENIRNGYNLWALPFHFCSFFIFWPIFTLVGKGKIKEFGDNITFIFSIIIVMAILINPNYIYGEAVMKLYTYGQITHSFVFHEFVFLYMFLYIFLDIIDFKTRNWYFIPVALGVYSGISIPLAYILNINYCSILYSEIDALEKFRLNTNQVVYNICEIIFGLLLMLTIFFICCFISKLKVGNRRKKINAKSNSD